MNKVVIAFGLFLSAFTSTAFANQRICGQVVVERVGNAAVIPSVYLVAEVPFLGGGMGPSTRSEYLLDDEQGGALVYQVRAKNGQNLCVRGYQVPGAVKTFVVTSL